MKSVVVLLFFGFTTGYALQCYNCNSQTIDGCKKGSKLLNETTCVLQHPDFKMFCILKVVYDNQLQKDNVLSGCEITEKMKFINKSIEQCQTDNRYQVKDCIVCDSDLCNYSNSANSVTSSFLYVINGLIVFKLMANKLL